MWTFAFFQPTNRKCFSLNLMGVLIFAYINFTFLEHKFLSISTGTFGNTAKLNLNVAPTL